MFRLLKSPTLIKDFGSCDVMCMRSCSENVVFSGRYMFYVQFFVWFAVIAITSKCVIRLISSFSIFYFINIAMSPLVLTGFIRFIKNPLYCFMWLNNNNSNNSLLWNKIPVTNIS